jgi:hypothetical protein
MKFESTIPGTDIKEADEFQVYIYAPSDDDDTANQSCDTAYMIPT